MGTNTPETAPPSPFFAPTTPQVTVVQQTPGGTRRSVKKKSEVEEHKSGLVGCTANLVNAIVGSGIVGIPYAIKQAGFVAGVILVIACAILTDKSLRLLIATAKHVHCPSYETAAEAAFGVAGFRFVTLNMFIMAYGAMLSYLMIVKDSFSAMFGVDPDNLPVRRAVLLVVSLAVQLPLSSKRDMADLAFTSRLSVIIDTVLVFLVAYNAPVASSLESIGGFEGLLEESVHWNTIFVGLGVLSFAFVCQHSAFIIAGSMEKPTIARWSVVTRSALSFCGVLALICGTMGYIGFLGETRGNVLKNLDPSDWTANVARASLGITMLFVFPLECFVARHVCVVLLFTGRRAHEGDDSTILNRRDRRIGLTALLYLTAVVPAASFEELGPVLAITGAIGGSCLSYIGPGLVYLGVHGERFMELVGQSWLGSVAKQQDKTKSRKRGDRSGESTPLVDALPNADADDSGSESTSEFFLVAAFKWFSWFLLGMPFWVAVARAGNDGLVQHAHDMASKSPHPIRIGDVEYARSSDKRPDQKSTIDASSKSPIRILSPGEQLVRHDSLNLGGPPSGLPPPSPSTFQGAKPGGINQMLGKELLQKRKIQEKKVVATEKDPQEAPAGWCDFAVAIFYVLFGILALFAGVVSLFQEEDSSNMGRYL